MKTFKNVTAYMQSVETARKPLLAELRALIQKTAPDAEEGIAYGMPAYTWKPKTRATKPEPLIYFAAMKGHLGIYPTPGPIKTLTKELADFSTSKGCIRVPYTMKLPKTIIVKLIKERMREIKAKG
jgi:uncharacterized protein YdhG (YjbR/CyaY superfamily)